MPGSLVLKPGLVSAGHLCPCQAKSPLSSRPSAHATLRLNPPSLFSSVQSPGPPPSSRQAWLGAIRAPAPGWCRWVRLAASDTAQAQQRADAPAPRSGRCQAASSARLGSAPAGPALWLRLPAAPAAAAVAPARLGRIARLCTLGPASAAAPRAPPGKLGRAGPPPRVRPRLRRAVSPRPHAARSGLLLRPQTTPRPSRGGQPVCPPPRISGVSGPAPPSAKASPPIETNTEGYLPDEKLLTSQEIPSSRTTPNPAAHSNLVQSRDHLISGHSYPVGPQHPEELAHRAPKCPSPVP